MRSAGAVLGLAWLLLALGLVYGLDWGLPRASWARILQRYESRGAGYLTELGARKQERLRDTWEESGARSVSGLIGFTAERSASAATLDEVETYDTFHKYLVSTRGDDEASALATIRRMAREGRGFDPMHYRYGGAYLYPLSAWLAAGWLAGLVPMELDPEVLLADPAPMARVYLVARSFSAASILVALGIVAWLVLRRRGDRLAALAALGLAGLSPFAQQFARSVKPNAETMALVALAMGALYLHHRSGGARWLVAASVFPALATAAHVTCAPIALLPAAYVLLAPAPAGAGRWRRLALQVAVPGAIAFLAVNPFLFTNLAGFAETVLDSAPGNEYGWAIDLSWRWPARAAAFVARGMGPGVLILAALGILQAIGRGDPYERAVALTALAGLAIAAAYFADHARFAAYLTAPFAYLAGAGLAGLRALPRGRHAAPLAAGLLLAAQGAVAAESWRGLALERSGVIEEQVERYLDAHEIAGRSAAFDGKKLRPNRHPPLPLFGLRWHRFSARESWPEDLLPDLLLLQAPIESQRWPAAGRYRAAARFGIDRPAWHRRLSIDPGWYRSSHLALRER